MRLGHCPPASGVAAAAHAAGVPIPARAIVLIVPWVLHRHRLPWSDPDRFDPDQFPPVGVDAAEPPARFFYLQFGSGPRACIGAQFALTETVLVLARVLRAFRLVLADDVPVESQARITLQPDRSPAFPLGETVKKRFTAKDADEARRTPRLFSGRAAPITHLGKLPLALPAGDPAFASFAYPLRPPR